MEIVADPGQRGDDIELPNVGHAFKIRAAYVAEKEIAQGVEAMIDADNHHVLMLRQT
jgi:hypothetical protein